MGQGLGWCCLFTAKSYLFHRFSLVFPFIFLLTYYHYTFTDNLWNRWLDQMIHPEMYKGWVREFTKKQIGVGLMWAYPKQPQKRLKCIIWGLRYTNTKEHGCQGQEGINAPLTIGKAELKSLFEHFATSSGNAYDEVAPKHIQCSDLLSKLRQNQNGSLENCNATTIPWSFLESTS